MVKVVLKFFYFCSFDLCGQSEPRADDKSDQTSMSQRLRDNPAVCHLNSFRGGGCSLGRRAKKRIGRVRQRDKKWRQECADMKLIMISYTGWIAQFVSAEGHVHQSL